MFYFLIYLYVVVNEINDYVMSENDVFDVFLCYWN